MIKKMIGIEIMKMVVSDYDECLKVLSIFFCTKKI